MNQKSKIFIGLMDIASFIDDWRFGFEQNTMDVLTMLDRYQSVYQSSKIDIVIQEIQNKLSYYKPGKISEKTRPFFKRLVRKYYFNKALRECDVFVFIWQSFSSDFSDYEILKKKGKKMTEFINRSFEVMGE